MEGDYVIWPEEDNSSTVFAKKEEEEIFTSKHISKGKIKHVLFPVILSIMGCIVYLLLNLFITTYDTFASIILTVATVLCCLILASSLLFMIYLIYHLDSGFDKICKEK